jgi:RNA polymerase sigma factor CnrH
VSADPEETDAQLVRRALAGEERAFTLLMRRHKDGLYRFARRYTGDADEAYEIVQFSFISAWKALERFETARAFDVWLRAIALNKCRDRARRAKVRRLVFGSPSGGDGAMPEPPSPAPDPEAETSGRDELRAASDAIAALPDGLKAPLILTAIEGLTMAEAAQVLGMTPKAVENRLYRARRALAETLGPRQDD